MEASSMAKTVTSLFGSEAQASSIVRRLESAGISGAKICLFTEGGSNRFWDGASSFGDRMSGSSGTGSSHTHVADFLMRNGVPTGDAHAFAEGVRRGHSLIAVRCDDDDVAEVIRILDGDDALDLDQHQSTWRSEGWTGGMGMGAAGASTSGASMSKSGMGASGTGSTSTSRSTTGRDQVIPVAEEELHVGKREVSGGRVRIHSHVVERPVQEQVSLREENVHVERRPVEGTTRTGTAGREGLFQERTIEMDEKREEAVVSKEARVKEELVVKKDVNQRTETISDTVRSTEVTVEDERGNKIPGTGTTNRKL
jgi:uncharacterized protein (TIGR02271 family)